MTRTLILQNLKKAETDVSSLLDGELWMSKTTQEIFSMTAHHTREHVREHAHIGTPITTSTDGESLAVPIGNVINQFNLESKLVGITSDLQN